MPDDLSGLGVGSSEILLDQAEIRLGMSDPRGLQSDASLKVAGKAIVLKPGNGPASGEGAGMHALFDWSQEQPLTVEWSYSLRGSSSFSFAPLGKSTDWTVRSQWQHPSFSGSFLPDAGTVQDSGEGFDAKWSISNLALGQSTITKQDPSGQVDDVATIRLMEPVDVYSQVDRAVKYAFLFIGFTFLVFFMFDAVGGVRVSAPEYLLTGAGLVLFFVLLLAFAEVVGFTAAYAIASGAIIGLLTAYSAAVLSSWKRAKLIAALLVGLYGLLYVLLSLEAYSLLLGSVMLFFVLAGVMYATRGVDWSAVNRQPNEEALA